tara:strand:- start:2127 stop:2666 length:540 start_codon:yes stop_codon:yes gene_type:complete
LSGRNPESVRGAGQMSITNDQLKRLLRLVLHARRRDANQLDEELLRQLSVAFVERTIGQDLLQEKKEPVSKKTVQREDENDFIFSTKETARKLHVPHSDLRALRVSGQLKKGIHYETGWFPRPTAIWYDINKTCLSLHEVTWEEFSSPGFDIEANTNRRITRTFKKARLNQPKIRSTKK